MHSYSTIYNFGHRALEGKLAGPVIVEEKIDGSQISFGVFDGQLRVRSKGADINIVAPEKMFARGVESIQERSMSLTPGWTYRGEYLSKPKHNALAYERVPANNIILFDVDYGDQRYADATTKAEIANGLGYECVPVLFAGVIDGPQKFRELLETLSVLGGQKIEGVVVKPQPGLEEYGPDRKVLMGKFVSEAFKEVHSKSWRVENPTNADIVERLAADYATQARWQKALMHLRERGVVTDSPADIGALFKEVALDTLKECEEEIRAKLFEYAWPKIQRKLCKGLPDWYKDLLMKKQFETEETIAVTD